MSITSVRAPTEEERAILRDALRDSVRIVLDPRDAEIARLRAALRGCVEAHEAGRYEPAQAAYEAAKGVLADE